MNKIKLVFIGFLLVVILSFINNTLVSCNEVNFSYQDSVKLLNDTCKLIIEDSIQTSKTSDSSLNNKFYYGIASFYSKNLEGTETSTGEIFHHNQYTAASNRFKLNTWLKVTNLSNNKSIIVRINDRMHSRMDAKGRIVDLSFIGAKKLDFIRKGITKVKVEIVAKPNKE